MLSNIFSNHRSNFEAPEFTEVYIEKTMETTTTMVVKRIRKSVICKNQVCYEIVDHAAYSPIVV